MVQVFVILLFLLASVALGARTDRVRELERALAGEREGRAELLVQLAEALETTDPVAAEARAVEAQKLARTPAERLRAEVQLAALQRRRGEYGPALTLARAGLERATELGDDALRTAFLFVIAQTHWSLAEYPEAIATYQQVIALARAQGDARYVARAEAGMGIIYGESDQWDLAYPHHERALALARSLDDPQLVAGILNNLGNCYRGRNDYRKAWAAHREALEIRRAEGNLRGEGDSLLNLGNLAMDEENYQAGLDQIMAALAIYERLGLKRHQVNARALVAFALQNLGRTDEALEHLRAALALAEALGTQTLLEKVHRGFAEVHEARGDYRAALAALRLQMEAAEKVVNDRTREQIGQLNVRYETERRERELAVLRHEQEQAAAELARDRQLRYSLAAVIALGVLASAAVFSGQRMKLRAERRVVAETQAARAAAEEANAMKTRLLGLASHDLKGPLRSMIRGAEAIAAAPDDRALVLRRAQLLRGTGEQLFAFVRDLIDVAALEAGMLRVERRLVDVAALAGEVVALHGPRAQEKEQPFTFQVEGESPHLVLADRARLRQVIDNLVDNALKFTPVGRAVGVTVSRTNQAVNIAVRDEGPGLMPEDYARMFQPFQRLSAQPTGGESSSGLGLSIARELVSLHGGQLIVDSVPGQGATFTIELPVAEPATAPATLAAPAAEI